MNSYPVILIPENIEHPYVDGEPQPPVEPRQKDVLDEAISGAVNGAITAGWLSVPALLIGAAVVGIPGLAIATTVTGIAALAGGVNSASKAEEYNTHELPSLRKQYSSLLEQHRQKLEEFKRKLPEMRKNARSQAIAITQTFDSTNSRAPSGAGEQFFERYLHHYFGNNIHTKLAVKLYQDFPYTPDFAYIDLDSNLHIDIEIDEPYSYKEKKPIHCIGDNKERVRNDHFKSRGWLVIRFAEKQVVEQPHECCALLAQIISELTEKHYPMSLNKQSVGEVNPVRRWTYSEAVQMSQENYRDSYLGRIKMNSKVA